MDASFPTSVSDLDQMLAIWEAPADDAGGPTLAQDAPPESAPPDPVTGVVPPGEMPPGLTPGAAPPGFPPAQVPPEGRIGGFESFDAHYNRLRGQYGDRAVMLVLTGLPTNSDPARGVTKHDVEDAIDKRLKDLAPEAQQSMSTGSGDARSICLAPVDDVKHLADSIDFGTASRNGSQINVVVAKEYIASVERLPAAPAIAARPHDPREAEAPIPADADAVTKSMIQLKSTDVGRKKEALNRLLHTRANERDKEVLAAILPLLEHDDEDLVKHAVRVMAVWQSSEAMTKLIEMVADHRVFLRWDVIKSLGKYEDSKAAEALVGRLKEDAHLAEESLKSMGPVAEPSLIPLLRNPDSDLRKKACEILKFVGGKATLKAMDSLPRDPEFFVRVAAQDAYKMINLRVGAVEVDSTEKKAGTPPRRSRKN
jgi:hypothetical protein